MNNLISNWFFQQFLHEYQWWIWTQWWRRHSIQSNAHHFIKYLVANNQIEMQYLKKFNRFRWRCSLIKQCIFEIAHVLYWTIFETFFWVISISSIFFDWLIIFDQQCFNRKCQFQKIIFVKIFLWNWITLTNFSTNWYFKKNKSCFFLMSHIITSIDLIINVWYVLYKVLFFKMSYEHQNNVDKWYINNVVKEHSSIFFVNEINDEHDFIFFNHHRVVWCIN
jgi:hypothetical protein